jgi:hypothetical protein
MIFQTKEIAPEVCFHTFNEGEFKYIVPHSLYNKLQLYLLQFDVLSSWYKNLTDSDREKIQKVGAHLY